MHYSVVAVAVVFAVAHAAQCPAADTSGPECYITTFKNQHDGQNRKLNWSVLSPVFLWRCDYWPSQQQWQQGYVHGRRYLLFSSIRPTCSTTIGDTGIDTDNNEPGHLKHPSFLVSGCQTETLSDCRAYCLRTDGCATFEYASGNATCNLFTKSLPMMVYRAKQQDLGGVFYNQHCFQKTCCTDAEAPNVCGTSCTDLQTDDNKCGTCNNQVRTSAI